MAAPTQTRRILALFRPYRWRLSGLLAMIMISAGISLISPFLLRDLRNAPALGDEQPEEEAPGLACIVTHATIIIENRDI